MPRLQPVRAQSGFRRAWRPRTQPAWARRPSRRTGLCVILTAMAQKRSTGTVIQGVPTGVLFMLLLIQMTAGL